MRESFRCHGLGAENSSCERDWDKSGSMRRNYTCMAGELANVTRGLFDAYLSQLKPLAVRLAQQTVTQAALRRQHQRLIVQPDD